MTRRLTNQDAFDNAMLSLLNQGHSCTSSSGHARYRGPRGKSAIGALIPDELYVPSLEGKNIRHWLAARASEYDGLRAHLGSVTPSLLDELQDLHDRIGSCMPSLYRQLAVAGAQRIAQSFKLSMRLVYRCAAYQSLRGPYLLSMVGMRPAPVAPRTIEVAPAPARVAAPMPAVAPASARLAAPTPAVAPVTAAPPPVNLVSSPMPAVVPAPERVATPTTLAVAAVPAMAPELATAPMPAAAPGLAAAPTPAAASIPALEPKPSTQPQENDLDLIARGIAKAIAAARARDQPGSKP